MANPAPIPWSASVLQLGRDGKPLQSYSLSKDFGNWLQTSIVQGVASAATIYSPVSLTGQSASISTTPLPLPALAGGFYRVNYYARITTVDPSSSSLTIGFSWTESSVVVSASGAAMTGNTTTTYQSLSIPLLIDASSAISYQTTYSSNTPGTMKYRLFIQVEAL